MLISEIPKSNVVVGDISKTIGYTTEIIVFFLRFILLNLFPGVFFVLYAAKAKKSTSDG